MDVITHLFNTNNQGIYITLEDLTYHTLEMLVMYNIITQQRFTDIQSKM